jgi:hypothetical protein
MPMKDATMSTTAAVTMGTVKRNMGREGKRGKRLNDATKTAPKPRNKMRKSNGTKMPQIVRGCSRGIKPDIVATRTT